jgi:hypothetical protein
MKKWTNNGKAPDDLAALFAAINTAPAPDPAAAGSEAGKAELLAALADGSLFAPGAGNLGRIAAGVAAGVFDGAAVSDEQRKRIVDHLGGRLQGGDPQERAAAAAALEEVLRRPGAQVVPPEATAADGAPGPSETAADGGAAEGSVKGGRDRAGRFQRGNRFSKGNPFSRRLGMLRAALLKSLDEAKLEALGDKLYLLAIAGDVAACELLLRYAIGRPGPAVDPDALDVSEWKLLTSGPTLSSLWHAAHEITDSRFAAEVWRRLSAASADAATDQLVDAVQREPGRFAKDLAAERRSRLGK